LKTSKKKVAIRADAFGTVHHDLEGLLISIIQEKSTTENQQVPTEKTTEPQQSAGL